MRAGDDLKVNSRGGLEGWVHWGESSAVKSADCSSTDSEFNSQQPHGGSPPFVMGSNALFRCV